MNNILLTGGAGHIGSHTFVALREADFEPVILDNFRNRFACSSSFYGLWLLANRLKHPAAQVSFMRNTVPTA